jgi:membrane protease YdiL (CAAX protease family)
VEKDPNREGEDPLGESRSDAPGPAFPMVPAATVFYGVLFGLAWLWTWLVGDSLWFDGAAAEAAGVRWGRDVGAGLIAAALTIALSWELTRRTELGRGLARALAGLIGRLDWKRCVLLAAMSGLAEEAFFRGALQPRIGLLAASVLFALAHFVPRRDLVAWSAFSLAAGLLLGALFEATGNLVAPIVAHAGINAVNLWLLGRGEERF